MKLISLTNGLTGSRRKLLLVHIGNIVCPMFIQKIFNNLLGKCVMPIYKNDYFCAKLTPILCATVIANHLLCIFNPLHYIMQRQNMELFGRVINGTTIDKGTLSAELLKMYRADKAFVANTKFVLAFDDLSAFYFIQILCCGE